MATQTLLLFLLVCIGERLRDGTSVAVSLSEEDHELQVKSQKNLKILPHPKSTDTFSFQRIKELEDPVQNNKDKMRTQPGVAFKLNETEPNDFDFAESSLARQTVVNLRSESTAKSLMLDRTLQPTVTPGKRSNLTNSEDEVVNNGYSLDPSAEEEHAVQPELRLETGVDVLLQRTQGRSKWVVVSEDNRSGLHLLQAEPRSRRRRSWLWNQFFVIEEYRGPEPVLIGRVSCCHNRSEAEHTCESPLSSCSVCTAATTTTTTAITPPLSPHTNTHTCQFT